MKDEYGGEVAPSPVPANAIGWRKVVLKELPLCRACSELQAVLKWASEQITGQNIKGGNNNNGNRSAPNPACLPCHFSNRLPGQTP